MTTILRVGHIKFCIYEEQGAPHKRLHCNVRWSGLNCQVSLDNLELLAGPEPPELAWITLEREITVLRDAWNQLNPGRRYDA